MLSKSIKLGRECKRGGVCTSVFQWDLLGIWLVLGFDVCLRVWVQGCGVHGEGFNVKILVKG